MKIGLTGASGTGKTTLAKAISKKYNLRLITNVARTSPGAQFGMLTTNSQKSNQFIIMNTLQFWSEQDNIVSDRIVLDAFLYTRGLTELENNYARSIVEKNLKQYDLIIYCPDYGWDVDDEGVRNLDVEYQSTFCNGVFVNLYYYDIKYLEMKNVSVEERLKTVDEYLISQNLI